MNKKSKIFSRLALGSVGILGFLLLLLFVMFCVAAPAAIGATIVYFLWNRALADLFHGPHLTWLQTFGILWLLGIVTGMFAKLRK